MAADEACIVSKPIDFLPLIPSQLINAIVSIFLLSSHVIIAIQDTVTSD